MMSRHRGASVCPETRLTGATVAKTYLCPYLGAEVVLSDERERHIAERHPELLPDHLHCIHDTLADPDQIRRSTRIPSARLFSRWFESIHHGDKYVVVVVVSESSPRDRHWIITAYLTRRLAEGEAEWKRD